MNPFEKPKHEKQTSLDLGFEAMKKINENPGLKEEYEKLKNEDPNKAREMVRKYAKKIDEQLQKPIK